MKPKHTNNGFDDDPTPVERVRRRADAIVIPPLPAPPHVVLPPANTDPPTKRHIADVWKTTVVSCWAMTVVGVLAAIQHWPHEVTLGAIGALTGFWAFGAALSGKRS